jgi:mono/diheme cytochrome c family protein
MRYRFDHIEVRRRSTMLVHLPVRTALITTALALQVPVAAAAAQAQTVTSLAGIGDAAPAPVAVEAPTFYEDVLPILQRNCQTCHQSATQVRDLGDFYASDLVAPMALEEYEEVRRWSRVIATVVEQRRMPPWGANIRHRGTFEGERYLEHEEIATLVAWAEAGAPAGNPAHAPPPRATPSTAGAHGGWAIGTPDLVVQVPEPWRIEDNVLDMYVDLHIPLSEEEHPEPRWIKAGQLIPGSPAVHHINSPYLGTVAPGRGPNVYPPGFGVLLPKNETLVLEMHYHKEAGPGTAVDDQTRGGLVFYQDGEVITHMVETLTQFQNGSNFVIPAGDPNFSHSSTRYFEEDTYLLSTSPHMHLRGKAAKLEIEYPDGEVEVLLDIPNYDFAWQHIYVFKEPFLMPGGSTLRLTFWWDNSADNPHNPDPTRDVPFGLSTTDEMGTGRIFFAKAAPIHHVVGDPIPEELFPQTNRWERSHHGRIMHLDVLEDHEDGHAGHGAHTGR